MPAKQKIRLTKERIRQIEAPEDSDITVWDSEVAGLGVRCLPSGTKSYVVMYRAGEGRNSIARRITLSKVNGLRLEDAREMALDIRADVLRGKDPVLEKRERKLAERKPELTLSEALQRYYADQERRGVVDRKSVKSSLDRHLLAYSGDIPARAIDRRLVVEAVNALEAVKLDSGKVGLPGAARALRSNASTFLKWCSDQGLIEANPLLGYRAARATRAQRMAQPGRELSEAELVTIWHACDRDVVNAAYGALVRTLILTGQRRTETARMRWVDVDLANGIWTIPAGEAKNGVEHRVPLPPLSRVLISQMHGRRISSVGKPSEWVFTTNGTAPISGWSKLFRKLNAEAAQLAAESDGGTLPKWTLHDLRRTFRSGMTRLGVDQDVAEIMLNHRPATLRTVYDRDPQMEARVDAAERWADHVAGLIRPDGRANVVELSGVQK